MCALPIGPEPGAASPPDRRRFLEAAGLFGLTLAWPAREKLFPDSRAAGVPADPRAAGVVHIFLQGGLSHLDSFDPKPYAPIEVRGDFGTAATPIPGECLAEPLGRTARIADKLAVIRSFTHGEAAHERATHSVLTGYAPSPALTYPSCGAVAAHELGGRRSLPPYVAIPDAREEYLGTGYLGSAFGPFSVGGEPNARGFAVRDLEPPKGVDLDRVRRRRALVDAVDRSFDTGASDMAAASDAFYEQAYALIETPSARAAFDIGSEPKEVRDRYGRTNVGQRLLLARRLVEAGARWVTVLDSGYDHHNDIFRILRNKLDAFDQGFSTLIADLSERGLLDSTIVLVTTEFGRTSIVNRDRGRDHWSRVFSAVAAGGGFKGGVFHGASTATGTDVERDPVTPADLAATVFTLLGIDPAKKLLSPGDRPIDIVREGRVVKEILA